MAEFWDIIDAFGEKTGRVHLRGKPMGKHEYHLVVSVWITNSKGEFLISQRAATKTNPNIWEPTCGSVLAGEDSLTAALRETKEELGVTLIPQNGHIFQRYTYPHGSGDGTALFEVWVFYQDIDSSALVLQPEETSDAIWASAEQIIQMVHEGKFTNFTYLEELFGQ